MGIADLGLPVDVPSTALFTDQYELTMLKAALAAGTAGRRSVFEVFTRRLPEGRRYGVVAGTGRVLDAVENFRFDSDVLGFLRERGIWRVFVVGLARDFCVRWTAEDAVAAGFKTVVVDDLTRSVFPARASETSQVFERTGVKVLRSLE